MITPKGKKRSISRLFQANSISLTYNGDIKNGKHLKKVMIEEILMVGHFHPVNLVGQTISNNLAIAQRQYDEEKIVNTLSSSKQALNKK